jgi:outer membrane protein, heavy metal efflux system
MMCGIRIPFLILITLVLMPNGARGQALQVAPLPGVDELISQGLTANPDLQAGAARWRVYENRIAAADSLDDPRLALALANYPVDTLSDSETPMTGKVVRLTQNFPFPGKLAAKGEIARQQAVWYREAYRESRLQLIRQIKEGWLTLYLQSRLLAVTEQSLKLLADYISLSETRYATGKGQQAEILKAQLERSALLERRLALTQQRDTALAALNTLVNRDPQTPVDLPEELTPSPFPHSLEELTEKAAAQRPLVGAYQGLLDQTAAQKKLARLSYYPDLSLGAVYTFREENRSDQGTDFVGLEFSVNLPFFREKRHSAVNEAGQGETMVQHQLDDFLNKARFAIHEGYAQLEKNRQLLELYRGGIIPQATQSFEAAASGYQVGRQPFTMLLENLLALYRYENEYYRVLVDHERNVARLEAEAALTLARWPEAGDHPEARPEPQP